MGAKVHKGLTFTAEWEDLDWGSPEERAAFGAIGLLAGNECLTMGLDKFTDSLKRAPLVSGFYLAEWIAWNWWRLRWEPEYRPVTIDRGMAHNWKMAHKFTAVGNGYVWPDVTICSDGKRTRLVARPTPDNPDAMYRYLTSFEGSVPSREFERATDEFITLVCERMDAKKVQDSNLHALWHELQSDRRDSEIYRRRKLEALMGYGPEEVEPEVLDTLIDEATDLGESAVEELAVTGMLSKQPRIAENLENLARKHGVKISRKDSFHFPKGVKLIAPTGDGPAWVSGVDAAKKMRQKASLGDGPISNKKLCELAAIPSTSLSRDIPRSRTPHHKMAFVLDKDQAPKMVLRSKWETGRRFELARLIGDQLVGRYGEQLCPATQTYTYRQKLQRAFAAELLSPFEEVRHALADDYSDENQQLVAERFRVSSRVIWNQLTDNDLVGRDGLEAGGLPREG